MLTRREFGKAVAGSLAAASVGWSQTKLPRNSSRFGGVHIGAITYCYRSLRDANEPWSREAVDRLMDKTVNAYVQNRIDLAEFWIAFVEPPGGPGRGPTDPVARENLRKWRVSRPLDVFERARKKFEDAGIQIYSCMANLSDDLTDDEIEVVFDFAKTLKTSSSARIAPWLQSSARRHSRIVTRCTSRPTARTRRSIGIQTAWPTRRIWRLRSGTRRTSR